MKSVAPRFDSRADVAPYAVSVFISATLLFLVQPIVAKQMLPWFGGAAAVWTACMVFFQTVLLLGYLYAHWLRQHLGLRGQVAVHVTLLALSVAAVRHASGMGPPAGLAGHPAWGAIAALGERIGLPYFALSATSPLLQAWFSAGESGTVPYRLFALSNLGSLAALGSYPFAIEPTMDARVQFDLWRGGYALFAGLCATVAVHTWRTRRDGKRAPTKASRATPFRQAAVWVMLAACSSALLVAVTNDLCEEIAPIPLLWIGPLAVYLLSFVLSFDHDGYYRPAIYRVAVPAALAALVWVPANPDGGVRAAVLLSLGGLFIAAMFCHTQLVDLKPESSRLTSFYLCISLGGAMGAWFAGLVAPVIFFDYFELPVAVTVCLVLSLYFLFGYKSKAFLAVAATVSLVLLRVFATMADSGTVTYRGRNFYGALSIREEVLEPLGKVRRLVHGTTVHGGQALAEGQQREPRFYYSHDSGVGLALERGASARRVGIVGLGAGMVAAYSRPGDTYRYYEINPLVIELAKRDFTYLRDARGRVEIVEGDARLSLEGEAGEGYDVLVLDAFSGDSIPVHLLTREAFACYFRHLAAGGVIAVHVSNRYLELGPVVAGNAAAFGRRALRVLSAGDPARAISAADWILVTGDGELARELLTEKVATEVHAGRGRPWTDSYSNLLGVLK